MAADLSKIKFGAQVRISDGSVATVRGSYMSSDGLVLCVNSGGTIVDRNVLYRDVVDVVEEAI